LLSQWPEREELRKGSLNRGASVLRRAKDQSRIVTPKEEDFQPLKSDPSTNIDRASKTADSTNLPKIRLRLSIRRNDPDDSVRYPPADATFIRERLNAMIAEKDFELGLFTEVTLRDSGVDLREVAQRLGIQSFSQPKEDWGDGVDRPYILNMWRRNISSDQMELKTRPRSASELCGELMWASENPEPFYASAVRSDYQTRVRKEADFAPYPLLRFQAINALPETTSLDQTTGMSNQQPKSVGHEIDTVYVSSAPVTAAPSDLHRTKCGRIMGRCKQFAHIKFDQGEPEIHSKTVRDTCKTW
jgi:hypothetical protein